MSSDNIQELKSNARKNFLKRRINLPENEITSSNSSILKRVTNLKEFEEANTIHVYASMNKRYEVDTFSIIDYALKNGKKVIVPVMRENGKLNHCEIDSTDSLEPNSWGVPEPVNQKTLEHVKPDIIFVPMVAGDLQKNRLGYGKGYYDRFLSSVNGLKAGLLFEEQISKKILPTDSYDVTLDILITEKRVLR